MRFGWLAAAAAFMCVGSAGAATTITQNFSENLRQHDSTQSGPVGNLNLAPNQFISSATVTYTAGLGRNDIILIAPGTTATVTYTGGGTVYFEVPNIVSAFSISPFQTTCTLLCSGGGDATGSFDVPVGDLAYFAANPVYFGVAGNLDGSAVSDGQVVALTQQGGSYSVNGTIVYAIETDVPEPATWALMILGIGLAGTAFRRHRGPVPQLG